VSFGKPGTPGTTDPPFTEVDTVALVVEVEVAPVLGGLCVIFEVPVGGEYSGREYGARRSGIS